MSSQTDHVTKPEPADKFTASFKLLDKFQRQWTQIHTKSEANVNKVNGILNRLDFIEKSCSRRMMAIEDFVLTHRTLVKLDEQIKLIGNDLKNLESSFNQVEDLLLVLKHEKERTQAKQYMDDIERNCQAKIKELECLSEARRAKLRSDHLSRVEAFEREQQKELEERRAVLEKAFEEEKSRYLQNSGSSS